MHNYDFDEQCRMSHGVAVNAGVAEILLKQIPGALRAWLSAVEDDLNGTDWWVETESGHQLSVDVKARREDYLVKDPEHPQDDLALELWSDVRRKSAGWTLRTDKRTDYVLWFWSSTGRWCLIPFPMLCRVFHKHRDVWARTYQTATQRSQKGPYQWKSECVFVPRREVWSAIYRHYAKNYIRLDPPNDSALSSLRGSQLDFHF